MKTRKIPTILVLALGLLLCWAVVSEAVPMGTAFTYQGRLTDANNAANGMYDFQFKLYDSNSGPNQVGSDVNVPGVDVMDGYFTVELDFGAVFDGDARWLEIGVRSWDPCDVNAFARLSPRQELTPTPYAIYAGSAGDAGTLDGFDSLDFAGAVHAHDAAQITSGTLNVARYSAHGDLSVEGYLGNGAGDLAQNNGSLQSTLNADMVDGLHSGSFAPSGHAHNAADITSGTLDTARYSARSDLSAEGYLGNAGGDIAQNNGVLQSTLNADMVDGYHAGSFLTPGGDYGRSGVSSTLYEGTTALANKYLGKSATATNSDRVDGYHASSFVTPGGDYGRSGVSSTLYEGTTALTNKYLGKTATATNSDMVDGYHASSFAQSSHNHSASNITSGTLSTSRYSAISDLSAEGYLGNASGDLAQNNGTVQTNLNADMVDGYHASSFAQSSHNHSASNITSGALSTSRYSAISDLSAEGYLGNASGDVAQNNGIKQTNLDADKLDGQHSSAFAPSVHNHDTRYAVSEQGALGNGTNRTMLTINHNGVGIFIRFGDENDENGVVFGQYANGYFSGFRADTAGNTSVFMLSSSSNVLDTGDYRLHYDKSSGPYKLVLYNDGSSDWCDYIYFKID